MVWTNAAFDGLFSLRKLRPEFSGACLRVRRSIDSTEQDIGFTDAGVIDSASLAAFIGAGSGFVRTWYNQTGGGNAQMTTAARQPQVAESGSVITDSKGFPVVLFDGTDDGIDFTAISAWRNVLMSVRVISSGGGHRKIYAEGTGSGRGWAYHDGKRYAGNLVETEPVVVGNWTLLDDYWAGANSSFRVGGVDFREYTGNPGTNVTSSFRVGSRPNGVEASHQMVREFAITTSALADTDRAAAVADMVTYYNPRSSAAVRRRRLAAHRAMQRGGSWL